MQWCNWGSNSDRIQLATPQRHPVSLASPCRSGMALWPQQKLRPLLLRLLLERAKPPRLLLVRAHPVLVTRRVPTRDPAGGAPSLVPKESPKTVCPKIRLFLASLATTTTTTASLAKGCLFIEPRPGFVCTLCCAGGLDVWWSGGAWSSEPPRERKRRAVSEGRQVREPCRKAGEARGDLWMEEKFDSLRQLLLALLRADVRVTVRSHRGEGR